MSFRISYRPLCNVNILHGYYLHPNDLSGNILSVVKQRKISASLSESGNYTILNDLSITPTSTTQQLMTGYRMVFRDNPFGFSLWLQAKEHTSAAFSPFIPFSEPLRLSFQLQVKQTSFWNFTNLSLDDTSGSLYYFSNQASNSSGGTQYLNSAGAYVSNSDRVTVRPNIFSLDVAALGLEEISFVLANDIHRSEITCKAESAGSSLETCNLDWSQSPTGQYSLTAFNADGVEIPMLVEQFYLNTGDMLANTLAIIDIFYLPSVDFNSYALLDSADNRTLLGPEYTLWWQNRLTHWRYLFDKPQSVSPDPNGDVMFTDPEQTQLVTRSIQPLISGHRPIRFRHNIAGTEINEETLLPNPGVGGFQGSCRLTLKIMPPRPSPFQCFVSPG